MEYYKWSERLSAPGNDSCSNYVGQGCCLCLNAFVTLYQSWNIWLLITRFWSNARYLTSMTPFSTPHTPSPSFVTGPAQISTSLPLRLIPDRKHLFKRHEAQFLRLSLSMVQSFRLAHRWFCLPGGKQKSWGISGRVQWCLRFHS